MATIQLKIQFLDYWHLSSGLSGGAQLDSSVVKDSNGLAYIPAKTLKGLAREMAQKLGDCSFVQECFGGSSDQKDPCFNADKKNQQGLCIFTNATIEQSVSRTIIQNGLESNLYDIIASTQIDKKTGVAKDNSLREIEVVVPLTLYATIENVENKHVELMEKSLQMIKRMGLNRNRGLGRCTIETEVIA